MQTIVIYVGGKPMLVLTRKLGEKIKIYVDKTREIEVQLLQIREGQVKIGITAPDDIEVHREEVTLKDSFKRGKYATG